VNLLNKELLLFSIILKNADHRKALLSVVLQKLFHNYILNIKMKTLLRQKKIKKIMKI